MSKTSKRAISILVIAILALSFVLPLASVSALTTVNIDVTPGDDSQVGDVITVSGAAGEVTSGATIKGYWDIAMGEDAYLLNTTTGKAAGDYSFQITIPDSLNGTHYIWVEDTATMDRAKSYGINITRKVELDPERGLAGDEFTVDGTGFSAENDITLVFWNATGVSGQVNYTSTYSETPTTDETGSFTVELSVPSDLDGVINYGTFYVNASDDVSVVNATATYIVGASILLTPDEGPEGTVIEITGSGFTPNAELSVGNITWDDTYSILIVDGPITIASNGEFEGEIVVPSWGEGDYEVNVSDKSVWANETFTIDGEATIEVSPTYGSPSAIITVSGYNFTQIDGTEVVIILQNKSAPYAKVADLVTAETNDDGTFEETFLAPAVKFIGYDVVATDEYDIETDDTFKVGVIALILHPTYGEAGAKIAITGIGFANGDYNLTFGDELYENYEDGAGYAGVSGEAISDFFWIPNVEPGTYDLTVIDTEENELTMPFSVTESTYVIMDPSLAPNEYNVTIEGYNFADILDGELTFEIYNSTEDWPMDVNLIVDEELTDDTAVTDDDGNFTAWWAVLDEDTLSLGDYTINVTDSKDILLQIPFSIVVARVEVAPRKALFDRGDSIQFDINNDFRLPDSYIEIYSPDDILYWSTELFIDAYWMQVAGLYTVPYYRQTDPVGNAMELQSDAPMGTWLYIFYDFEDTELMNGTFEVGPSTAAQVDERLTELWGSIEGLTEDIGEITSEIGDDIDALSGEIDDVVADVQDMVDDITSDLAGELAQVAEDTEAAVADLEDSIGDIASAQNDLASELDAVSADTTAAREAAEDAQTAASGLTTLVYGAIGASLIAALAAIVSLMQISKKIA